MCCILHHQRTFSWKSFSAINFIKCHHWANQSQGTPYLRWIKLSSIQFSNHVILSRMSLAEASEQASHKICSSGWPGAYHVRNLAPEFLSYVQSQMDKCCSFILGNPCFSSLNSLFLFPQRSFHRLTLLCHHHYHQFTQASPCSSFFRQLLLLYHT